MLNFRRVLFFALSFVLVMCLTGAARATATGSLLVTDRPGYPESHAVIAVSQDIFEHYGIVVADRSATWSLDEITGVRQALNSISVSVSRIVGHDASPTLKNLLRGVVFYRDNTAVDRIAYTLAGEVSFYDLWTTYDQTGRTFYVAHEMGHLLDTRTSVLHLLMGEISDEFARAVGAYRDDQGRYQPGAGLPHHGSPRSIRHRTDSASEDWAESFATVVVPQFEAELRDIGEARRTEVTKHLVEWSITSDPSH